MEIHCLKSTGVIWCSSIYVEIQQWRHIYKPFQVQICFPTPVISVFKDIIVWYPKFNLGGIQGQGGKGPEHPDLVGGILVNSKRVGTKWSLPIQAIIWFYDNLVFTKFEHQFQYQGAGRGVGAVYMFAPLAASKRVDELWEICSLTAVDAHILAHSSILRISEKNCNIKMWR